MKKILGLFIGGIIIGSLTSCGEMEMKSDNFIQVTSENYDKEKFYVNPQNISLIADPQIIKGEDGYYYAYGTSDKIQASGFLTWKSKDLINWEEAGLAFMSKAGSWSNRDYWAPEVYNIKGKYYLYYTARDKETKNLGLGVAKSDNPYGPFEDLTKEPIIGREFAVIDANVFQDGDKIYLYYVKDCSTNVVNGKNISEIYGVELEEDLITFKGEPILIATPEQEWEKASGDWQWNEGPFVIKRDNKYYLMYSAYPYWDKLYSVGYAVSDNPLIGFEKYEKNPVLTSEASWEHVSGTGHNSVIESVDGKELYSVYHSHMNVEMGGNQRMINIDKIGFREDKSMYINGPTLTPQPLPSGSGVVKNLNEYIDYIQVEGKQLKENKLLFDGEIVFHKEFEEYEWGGMGKTKIIINLREEKAVSDLMIYGNLEKRPEIKEVRLSEDMIISGIDSTIPKLPGEAIIVSFKETKTKEIIIELNNKGEFFISEIILMGK